LFDEDNVSLGKAHLMGLEGELSGKKGDSFRAIASFSPQAFERGRKIEARPAESEKNKDK
jgi:hypothetical protein